MNKEQVTEALTFVLTKMDEKINLISQFSGGWEGWLQCELSVLWKPGEVEREVALWGDRRASDLYFPSTKFCVELKCYGLNRAFKKGASPLHISNIQSTYTSFGDDIKVDINKLLELPPGYGGMSIIVVPNWLPDMAYNKIVAAIGNLHQQKNIGAFKVLFLEQIIIG